MGILDDVANEQNPQPTQTAPTSAPAVGGSLLDQVAGEQPSPAPVTTNPATAPESLVDRWTRKAAELIGHAVPQSAVPALQYGKEHLSDPLQRTEESIVDMGRKAGRLPAEALTGIENAGAYMPSPYGPKPQVESLEDAAQRLHPTISGVGEGVGTFAAALVTPTNLALMAAMPEVEARSLLSKLVAGGFAIQMSKGVSDQVQELSNNWGKMSEQQRTSALTQLPLQVAAALMSTLHAKGEILGEGEPKASPTEKPNTVKPNKVSIAGKESLASPLQTGEKQGIVARAVSSYATSDAAKKFQDSQRPAYTEQAVHSMGQRMEDRVSQHDALVHGDPEPEQIAGTSTASKYSTLDDMHNDMRQSSEQTYQKADVEDHKDIAAWEQEVAKARADYKDSVDHHNQNVKDYNATEEGKKKPMELEQFNPEDAKVPEKPDTYAQMKSDLQTAQNNAQSADPVVRQKAFDVEIPKANKAIDKWFSDHSDAISDAEYQSAKRLRADSEKVKMAAQLLRQPILDGNLSSGKMSQVEAAINRKSVKGGYSENAFANLLGDDGYKNWNDVKDLFKPINVGGGESWGTRTLAYIGEHLIGHLLGVPEIITGSGGLAGAFGASKALEWFSNKVMFDPQFGSFFKEAASALKNAGGSIAQFPTALRDKFVGLMDKIKSSSRGTAGADVPQGNEPIVGKPFGRSGLGGGAAADAAASDQAAQMKAQSGAQAAATSEAAKPKDEPIGGVDHDMKVSRRDNGDWEFNHPNGTSQMILHPEADTRPGFEGKTQLRQTGISAVDAPGAGQHMMDDATARMNGMDSVSRIISDHPDLRSPENEGHWAKLARRGHDVKTEPVETNSLGEPVDDGKVYSIDNKTAQPEPEPEPKAPQESVGAGHNPELEISTRKVGENNPTEHLTGWDAIEQAEKNKPGHIKKLLDEVMKYPDLGIKLSEDDLANPRQGLQKVVKQWADNLEWLHNKIPASIRNISKLWYDSANKLSNEWADTYKTTKQTAAGVIASLSPKNAWDINAGQARRMMDMYANQRGHEWSPEMETELNRAIEKIEPKVDKKTGKVKIDAKTGKPPVDAYKEGLQAIRGKTFAELEDPANPKKSAYQQALWFRMLDQAHGAKTTELYAPDGSVRGHIKMNWGMPEPMAKAVQMLKSDGSTDAIHQIIGDGHKIRNFYNNINSQNSPNGHATIDTHAGNADMLIPRGSNGAEVTGIFGGAPSHAGTGQSGMYSLHHEAYRRAAEKIGILPRELQSITWEGVKSLMGDAKKTPALKQAVSEIWQKHMAGELTLDGAREAIVKAANGFTRPPWMTGEKPISPAVTSVNPKSLPIKPTETPAFKNWFGKSKVVDGKGNPQVLYHGTTHEFDTFDPTRGNVEGHFGKGIYLSDSPVDASHNYAGEGPDLTSRIEQRAEEIADEENLKQPKYGTPEYKKFYDDLKARAKTELAGSHGGAMVPVYAKMENPLTISQRGNGTNFEINVDEDGNESGNGLKLYQAIHDVAGTFNLDPNDVWGKVMGHITDPSDFSAKQFDRALQTALGEEDVSDETGKQALGELKRQV